MDYIEKWTTWGLRDAFIEPRVFRYRRFTSSSRNTYTQDDVNVLSTIIQNLYTNPNGGMTSKHKERLFIEYLSIFIPYFSVIIKNRALAKELNEFETDTDGDINTFHRMGMLLWEIIGDGINRIGIRSKLMRMGCNLGDYQHILTLCRDSGISNKDKVKYLVAHFFYYIFNYNMMRIDNGTITGGNPHVYNSDDGYDVNSSDDDM